MQTDPDTGRAPTLRRGLNIWEVFVLARPGVARRAGQHLAAEEGLADHVR